ncbi:MAG: hypothetical protein IJC44_02065 [Clostridia bacterium]|nr:hypothetical protein [Clostridia bacterium]
MQGIRLRKMIFWALCCALGIFSKRLVAPIANTITGALHIPGGIGTAFSMMFMAVAAVLAPYRWSCTKMSAVQSALALSVGSVGSMGILSPLGYIIPGMLMDLVFALGRRLKLAPGDRLVFANAAGSVAAALTANAIVFHLWGIILLVYACVAALSGMLFGLLGSWLAGKLRPVITFRTAEEDQRS